MWSRKRIAATGAAAATAAALFGAGISVYIGSNTVPGPTGCASSTANTADGPDPWGGCWPGPTTTGPPPGQSFTTPSLDGDGNYQVTTNNAVIDGINLLGVSGEGGVHIHATGVTIKNSKVRYVLTDFAEPIADAGAHPTVIQDTEINCETLPLPGSGIRTAVYYGFYTLRRVDVTNCENGLDLASGHVDIQDSYWHDLAQCPESDCSPIDFHSGVVQGAPGVNALIQHNWMESINLADCTPPGGAQGLYDNGHCNASGTIGYNNTGSGSNDVLIKRNALKGGGDTIRCPQLPSTNFVVTENLMWPQYNPSGLSDDCAPFDAGDNRNGDTLALLTLT